MKSLILSTAIKFLLPLLILFSFFLLMRGHNYPGGGFVGGLVAASAFALYTLAEGVDKAGKILKISPEFLIPAGLLTAVLSGTISLFFGEPVFKGMWFDYAFPLVGKFGTPFLFDIGVYFVVTGITLKIIFTILDY
ncbi:MAG: Na+/H+ antiporter subunit B [Ignavibacteria bacterium]|nr:Na+/H+ antiporter subunit B [Ignavibacteria bacterium]